MGMAGKGVGFGANLHPAAENRKLFVKNFHRA
jgi:hypothetical protein